MFFALFGASKPPKCWFYLYETTNSERDHFPSPASFFTDFWSFFWCLFRHKKHMAKKHWKTRFSRDRQKNTFSKIPLFRPSGRSRVAPDAKLKFHFSKTTIFAKSTFSLNFQKMQFSDTCCSKNVPQTSSGSLLGSLVASLGAPCAPFGPPFSTPKYDKITGVCQKCKNDND